MRSRHACFGGAQGNKGAAGVSFRIYDSSMVVLNAHMAAHQNNTKGRNRDYHRIVGRLVFPGVEDITGYRSPIQAAVADHE